jgi:TolB-like protein/Flp pilus assembly protein TadD
MRKLRNIPKDSESGHGRHCYEFGSFRVDPRKRLLLRGGDPVALTPKALEILLVLLDNRGEVLIKEELLRSVWPDTVVEEGNLNRNISTLRKALGESPNDHQYIVTVPGRGYRFVAQVRVVREQQTLQTTDRASIDSVAVLPLQNLSGDADQEYFVDGLTEALVTDLAQIHALRVVSRTSIMRYKGTRKSLPEIARELNVDSIVEGSVLRLGARVRIMVQLIRARNDEHLWANTYDGELGDVFGLQSAVARAVVREVRVALTPTEQARLATVRLVNPKAYEAYLKGRYLSKQRTHENMSKSVAFFEQAIQKEPTYALAHLALAEVCAAMAADEFESPQAMVPKANQAARKALELDDQLGEAYATLAFLKFFYEWDFVGSEQQLRRALELSPNYSTAHHWYGIVLMYQRRFDESIQAIAKAQELDPLSPIIRAALGLNYVFAAQYDEAIRQANSLLEIEPNCALAHGVLGFANEMKGLYPQAIAHLRSYVELSGGDSDALMRLGCAYAACGDTDNARTLLGELQALSQRKYVSPVTIAALKVALGDNEGALSSLIAGLEERAAAVLMLAADPAFDRLRADARFQTLLHRVGLPLDSQKTEHPQR